MTSFRKGVVRWDRRFIHTVFGLGVTKDWKAKWYAEKNFGDLFVEDRKIRNFVFKTLGHAGVSNIVIERAANKVKLIIFTGRPGLVIGRKGPGR